MRKLFYSIIICMFLFSFYSCATTSERKAMSPQKLYDMSDKFGIEDPDEYWSKSWKEIDKDGDGFLSRAEVAEAYPEYGLDAFPYFDTNEDGQLSWEEYHDMIEKADRK
ncbi:MAG: EF-hand domain-containing protein [Deltaproteobacteria bacterium]|nr:EF-hand domain-containing protein [Deltaproteobacteria bacterium]